MLRATAILAVLVMGVSQDGTRTTVPVPIPDMSKLAPSAPVYTDPNGDMTSIAPQGLVGGFGQASSGSVQWVSPYMVEAGTPGANSVLSVSPWGLNAGLFASRTSDNSQAFGTYSIPLECFSLADGIGINQAKPECFYAQQNILVDSTAQMSILGEVSQVNNREVIDTDPMNENVWHAAIAWRIGAGTGSAGPHDISAFLDFYNNGARGRSGLVVGVDALDTDNGRIAGVLNMAAGHAIQWYCGRIFSVATSCKRIFVTKTSGSVDLILDDNLIIDSGRFDAASYSTGNVAGVTCPPGTVNLTTLSVINGLVTHC